MSGQDPRPGTPPTRAGAHPGTGLLAGYADGSADQPTAWWVEAHIARCAECRRAAAPLVGAERLARNRDVLLVTVATDGGPMRRIGTRCGLPDHVVRLLTGTPTLRLPWLLSVVGVLAVVVGEALLAAPHAGPRTPPGQLSLLFVLAAPLVVLASVAAAYLPGTDPTYRLTVAAPFPGLTLVLVRSIVAAACALLPVLVAALVVPGPGWLPAALVLPSLAVCALALAGAATMGPRLATGAAAVAWAVPVCWVGFARSAQLAVQWHGQAVCAVALLAAVAAVAGRRDRFDLGWRR